MIRNTNSSWGSISRLFHWVLAFVIIAMLSYGWWMNHLAERPDRLFHRTIHADIGYVVLLLMVIRLIWRNLNPVPALPADMPAWQKLSAQAANAALYGVTIVVALLGWAHSGAHTPNYASWFGLFQMPQFTSPDKANADFYEDWHINMAYVLMALVALHILAALYHLFARDDNVVTRMIGSDKMDRA